MELLQETLKKVKETKNQVVYGNDEIVGIYIPKRKLSVPYPEVVVLTLATQ